MKTNCPSCWAPLEILPGSIEIVCSYCKTILFIERWVIKNTWEKSMIVPFPTIFSIGKYFFAVEESNSNDKIFWKSIEWLSEKEFRDNNYEDYIAKIYVYWHIRCTNDAWFWDKWFADIIYWKEKGKVMIEEDEWLISVYKRINSNIHVNNFEKIYDNFINWNLNSIDWYFINEAGIANIEWFEWQYDFFIWKKQLKYIKLIKSQNIYLWEYYWNNILDFKKI